MSIYIRRFLTTTGCCAAGALIVLAAPATVLAEPAPPPPPPGPLMLQPAAPDAPIINAAAPIGPAPDAPVADAPPPIIQAADGTPHLPSPDALPMGTTMDPVIAGADSPNRGYLKDLWHAVQNQDISGKEAIILGLSQRGMNTPIPQQAPGPNVPTQFPRDPAVALPPEAAVPPPPAPAPEPLPTP